MARNSNRSKINLSVRMASYGTAKVYKTNHIKLDPNLLSTLGIQAGDRVEVFLDTEERAIVIKGCQVRNESHRNKS